VSAVSAKEAMTTHDFLQRLIHSAQFGAGYRFEPLEPEIAVEASPA
jgi:hypothetical protein